jgi:molybdenum cofactor cytidylyltransferase
MPGIEMKVAGIMLAAGESSRFPTNKLLFPLKGKPLVRLAVESVLDAGLDPLLVVVGRDGAQVTEALAGLRIQIVGNPDFEKGQSVSLTAGLSTLSDVVSAVIVGVADMPLLRSSTFRRLVRTFVEEGRPVVAARSGERVGVPVLFARNLFSELLELKGDRGARVIVQRHIKEASFIDVEEEELIDVDDQNDFERVQALLKARNR